MATVSASDEQSNVSKSATMEALFGDVDDEEDEFEDVTSDPRSAEQISSERALGIEMPKPRNAIEPVVEPVVEPKDVEMQEDDLEMEEEEEELEFKPSRRVLRATFVPDRPWMDWAQERYEHVCFGLDHLCFTQKLITADCMATVKGICKEVCTLIGVAEGFSHWKNCPLTTTSTILKGGWMKFTDTHSDRSKHHRGCEFDGIFKYRRLVMGSPTFWICIFARYCLYLVRSNAFTVDTPEAAESWDIDEIYWSLKIIKSDKFENYIKSNNYGTEISAAAARRHGFSTRVVGANRVNRRFRINSLGNRGQRMDKMQTLCDLVQRATEGRHNFAAVSTRFRNMEQPDVIMTRREVLRRQHMARLDLERIDREREMASKALEKMSAPELQSAAHAVVHAGVDDVVAHASFAGGVESEMQALANADKEADKEADDTFETDSVSSEEEEEEEEENLEELNDNEREDAEISDEEEDAVMEAMLAEAMEHRPLPDDRPREPIAEPSTPVPEPEPSPKFSNYMQNLLDKHKREEEFKALPASQRKAILARKDREKRRAKRDADREAKQEAALKAKGIRKEKREQRKRERARRIAKRRLARDYKRLLRRQRIKLKAHQPRCSKTTEILDQVSKMVATMGAPEGAAGSSSMGAEPSTSSGWIIPAHQKAALDTCKLLHERVASGEELPKKYGIPHEKRNWAPFPLLAFKNKDIWE